MNRRSKQPRIPITLTPSKQTITLSPKLRSAKASLKNSLALSNPRIPGPPTAFGSRPGYIKFHDILVKAWCLIHRAQNPFATPPLFTVGHHPPAPSSVLPPLPPSSLRCPPCYSAARGVQNRRAQANNCVLAFVGTDFKEIRRNGPYGDAFCEPSTAFRCCARLFRVSRRLEADWSREKDCDTLIDDRRIVEGLGIVEMQRRRRSCCSMRGKLLEGVRLHLFTVAELLPVGGVYGYLGWVPMKGLITRNHDDTTELRLYRIRDVFTSLGGPVKGAGSLSRFSKFVDHLAGVVLPRMTFLLVTEGVDDPFGLGAQSKQFVHRLFEHEGICHRARRRSRDLPPSQFPPFCIRWKIAIRPGIQQQVARPSMSLLQSLAGADLWITVMQIFFGFAGVTSRSQSLSGKFNGNLLVFRLQKLGRVSQRFSAKPISIWKLIPKHYVQDSFG